VGDTLSVVVLQNRLEHSFSLQFSQHSFFSDGLPSSWPVPSSSEEGEDDEFGQV